MCADSNASPKTNGPPPLAFTSSGLNATRAAIVLIFLAGLLVCIKALDLPNKSTPAGFTRWEPASYFEYLENDEKIYIALAEQLNDGQGYTLHGSPILEMPWVVRAQYDRPLFFHPPGGIAWFWLLHALTGNLGYALAQVLSFVIFFWSALLLGRTVLAPLNRPAFIGLAMVAAFSPILLHVTGRLWLDGPLLAFTTAAVAVFFVGRERGSLSLVCLAGALLGYASLIKVTAVLVIPGVAALAWAITPRKDFRGLLISGMIFTGIAGLIQLPWEIWQWRVVGSAFPVWAGKPVEQLVRTNPYVHFVTMVRTPWIYIQLLPQVVWTLVPSLVLWGMQWNNPGLRRRGLALIFWILIVVGFHMILGWMGYSKLLRYVILVTPATVLLFAMVVGGVAQVIREGRWLPGGKCVTMLVLCLALAGLGLEVTQGLRTSLVDNRDFGLIKPLPVLSRH